MRSAVRYAPLPLATRTFVSGVPWPSIRTANQYADAPSLMRALSAGAAVAGRYVIGTMPSTSSAIARNAVRLRSRWPGSHSGQRSITLTRTEPFGPVTDR